MTQAEYQALRAINWAVHLLEQGKAQASPEIVEQLKLALEYLEKA